jgi:hypothetical protein
LPSTNAPAGGRAGVAQIAAERAGVLDLHAADLARGRLQPVEQRRQAGLDHIRPGGRGAEAPAGLVLGDAAQARDGGEVEQILVGRKRDTRRVMVGTARQRHARRSRHGGQRLGQARRTQIAPHSFSPRAARAAQIVRVHTISPRPSRCQSARFRDGGAGLPAPPASP